MLDSFGRPDWDDWFLAMCYLIARRSIDPSTKHGCVVVAKDHTVLSLGYNGPLRGSDDSKIPLTRPEKYDWLLHSEENAIINAARNGTSLIGSTFYVTGFPCERCLRGMIGVGAVRIVCSDQASVMINDHNREVVKKMLEGRRDVIFEHKSNAGSTEVLQQTIGQTAWLQRAARL